MKLHFLGASRQVTGSRYILEAAGRRVMIDCGMFQERKYQFRNWDRCPLPACEVEALLLTHVHIDHSGLIPKLVKDGFRGPIYATPPSAALLEIMLRDSAEIQAEDAAYKKKRHQREGKRGRFPYEPLYTEADVDQSLKLVRGHKYAEPLQVTPEITARFFDAGHILGSAMLQIDATENGQTRRIVFSGDIGQWDKPLTRDPSLFPQGDYIVMESTYGDRLHQQAGDIELQLANIVNETHARGGNVIIPTFAVERAQELIYFFGRLVRASRIPPMPVFLDSPMAVDVTAIFARFREYTDEHTARTILSNDPPLRFPGLTMVRSANESKQINDVRGPCVIMASSGMCNAGRIKHHLKQNIERPESTILFVGHQGEGTLGRIILDGAKRVRIHGQDFQSRARIAQIFGFSGHSDKNGLLKWITHFKEKPRRVFLTHGEEQVSLAFADHIKNVVGFPAEVPYYQESFELI